MITLTDMGVMYIRTCEAFWISRLRNRLNGRFAARMHKGEAPPRRVRPRRGKVAVYGSGSVPRGQRRTTDPMGGPLRVYLRGLRSYRRTVRTCEPNRCR